MNMQPFTRFIANAAFEAVAGTLLVLTLTSCALSTRVDDDGTPAECVPFEDDCGAGRYCQYERGHNLCVSEGTIPRDAVCSLDRCERGSICMPGNDLFGNTCQQPCELDDTPYDNCDISRHTCFVAQDEDGEELDFGVCRY